MLERAAREQTALLFPLHLLPNDAADSAAGSPSLPAAALMNEQWALLRVPASPRGAPPQAQGVRRTTGRDIHAEAALLDMCDPWEHATRKNKHGNNTCDLHGGPCCVVCAFNISFCYCVGPERLQWRKHTHTHTPPSQSFHLYSHRLLLFC